MSEDTTDWTKLREFKAVDLTRSYVLSWGIEAESLLLDVDLFLCPDHAFYEPPRPAEKACFRPALIDFPHCVEASVSAGADSLTDSVGNLRPGKITGLQRTGEGRYQVSGDFGKVMIRAERPMVRLKSL